MDSCNEQAPKQSRFEIERLEERIAPISVSQHLGAGSGKVSGTASISGTASGSISASTPGTSVGVTVGH